MPIKDTELFRKSISDFIKKNEGGKTVSTKKSHNLIDDNNIYDIFNNMENDPEIIDVDIYQTPYVVIVNLKNTPLASEVILENIKNFAEEMRSKGDDLFGKEIKSVFYYKEKIFFLFEEFLYYKDIKKYNRKLSYNDIFYGLNVENNKLTVVDSRKSLHHNYLGATSTGKTVSLTNLYVSMSDRDIYDLYPNLRPKFFMLEKSDDFNLLYPFKNVYYKGNVQDISFDNIILFFFYLRLIYQYRNSVFRKKGNFNDVFKYNNAVNLEEKFGLIFIIIDEFRFLDNKFQGKNKEEFRKKIEDVTALYRNAGMYLYIGTQNFGGNKGVPTEIQGNIRTYVIGHAEQPKQYAGFLEQSTYETLSEIQLGDFIFKNPQLGSEHLLRTPFPFLGELGDDSLKNFKDLLAKQLNIPIKEELKDGDKYNDDLLLDYISNAESYGIKDLTNRTFELLKEFNNVGILDESYLTECGVDTQQLGLTGLKRISLIILSNVFKHYIEKVDNSIKNKLEPEKFDIDRELNIISEEYPIVSFVTLDVRKQYNNYCKGLIDSNINKKINKVGGGGGEDEEEDDIIQIIEDSMQGIVRVVSEKLAKGENK